MTSLRFSRVIAKEETILITPLGFSRVVVKGNSPISQRMALYLNIVDLS